MSKNISDPQNIYLLIFLGIAVTIYGPQFLPNIPKPIIDLFKMKWFRAVIIFLAIFLAQKDIVLSIVITTIFLIIMNIIQNKVLLETFMINYNQNIEGFLDGADISNNSNLMQQNPFANNSTSHTQYTALNSSLANTHPKTKSPVSPNNNSTAPSPPPKNCADCATSNQANLSRTKLLPLSTYDTCSAINQLPQPHNLQYVDLSQYEVGNVATSNDCPQWDGNLYKNKDLKGLAGAVYMGVPCCMCESFKNKLDTDLNSFPLSNCNAYNPVNLNIIGTSYYPINPNN